MPFDYGFYYVVTVSAIMSIIIAKASPDLRRVVMFCVWLDRSGAPLQQIIREVAEQLHRPRKTCKKLLLYNVYKQLVGASVNIRIWSRCGWKIPVPYLILPAVRAPIALLTATLC